MIDADRRVVIGAAHAVRSLARRPGSAPRPSRPAPRSRRRGRRPSTVTWPILRPGRTCLPYRWTLTLGPARRTGGAPARPCPPARPSAGPPSTLAITTTGAVSVGRAQRVVEHGPQVLLELRGPGALDGPVAGVVRPHRQLVDQQRAVGASRTARPPARRRRRARRRCAAPAAAAVDATSLGQPGRRARAPRRRSRPAARSPPPARPRPARTASGRPARPARGASAPAPRRSSVPCRRQTSSAASSGASDDPDAPAVVPAAGGLDHAPASRARRRTRSTSSAGRRPARPAPAPARPSSAEPRRA